jgi:hypothetical protein
VVLPPLRALDEDGGQLDLTVRQGGRDHSHPVRAAVGVRAGGDDDRVEQVVAELVAQPQHVADVTVPG